MSYAALPWLELTLLSPFLGALGVAFLRTPTRAARGSLVALLFLLIAALAAAFAGAPTDAPVGSGSGGFRADDLAAPMLPVLGILHLLTLLGTSKSRLSVGWCVRLLLSAGATSAAITCRSGAMLMGILVFLVLLPVWDLRSRGQPTRGLLVHVVPFLALLLLAWFGSGDGSGPWSTGLLIVALRLLGGVFPFHGWLPALFQRAGFGAAMLWVLPAVEVVVLLRFLVPVAPAWMFETAAVSCLVTSLYAAGMATVQDDVRRFYGYLALSQISMVVFAVLTLRVTGVTAALCLWLSLVPALAGLGMILRSLEARFGRLSLREHHGYYDQVPGLAVAFLLAGLASVGFPGTIGFVPMELLIGSSAQLGLSHTAALAAASLLNGVAILRAYFSMFTGRRPTLSVSLRTTPPERVGIVVLALLVLAGAAAAPAMVQSRQRVAERLLGERSSVSSPIRDTMETHFDSIPPPSH